MSPSPPRILPPVLQVKHLKRIFSKLNPDIDPQEVDWDITGRGPLDPTAPLAENRQNMENAYPQYTWFETPIEREEIKEQAIKEYEDFLDYLLGLAVIPEAREEMRPVLEKALSDYRYRTERNIEKATLRKTIKNLEKQLLEAKRTGKTQIETLKKEILELKKETERPKTPKPRLPPYTICPVHNVEMERVTQLALEREIDSRPREVEPWVVEPEKRPKAELSLVNIPETMEVFYCAEGNHLFERINDTSKERSLAFLLRKIERERKRVERLVRPPTRAVPTRRPPGMVSYVETEDAFKEYLRSEVGIDLAEYKRLNEIGKSVIRTEYRRWMRGR